MKRDSKLFLLICLTSAMTLFSAAIFWVNLFVAVIALASISAFSLIVLKNREYLYIYLFAAVFGPLAEATAVYFGAWTYTLPDLLGVPLWLPFVWGMTGVFIKKLSEEIHRLRK